MFLSLMWIFLDKHKYKIINKDKQTITFQMNTDMVTGHIHQCPPLTDEDNTGVRTAPIDWTVIGFD